MRCSVFADVCTTEYQVPDGCTDITPLPTASPGKTGQRSGIHGRSANGPTAPDALSVRIGYRPIQGRTPSLGTADTRRFRSPQRETGLLRQTR